MFHGLEGCLCVAILIVLFMILMVCNDIDKLTNQKSERFANEQEKLERANVVVEKVGATVRENPNMSFGQFKNVLRDGDAVEFRDVRALAAGGGEISAEKLAARW